MSRIGDLIHDILFRLANRGEDRHSVRIDGDDVLVERNKREVIRINIEELVRIEAYKKDLITNDPICLLLVIANGHSFEINEYMIGFSDFVETLTTRVSLRPTGWFSIVNKNAFEANRMTIWRRSDT